MLQVSKIVQSRNQWKVKAVDRAYVIRQFRKTKKRHKKKIAQLEAQIQEANGSIEEQKKQSFFH